MTLSKRLRDIEKKFKGANMFRLKMKDGTWKRMPVEEAFKTVLTSPGLVTEVASPEGQDNGILPALMEAWVTDHGETSI